MAYFLGIDIGSVTSKGVITENGELKSYHILISGTNYQITAQKLQAELLTKAGLSEDDLAGAVTSGHGASIISSHSQHIADVRCCARGINNIFPQVRTVIDVQGQSSQVIRIDEEGQIINFAVSELCAGGCGYFVDVIANVLQLELKDIGPLSLKSHNPVIFTTGCAVFGESEAISRVSEGISKEDILSGIHKALADKIATLIGIVGLEEECAISGGGGLNIGLIKKIEEQGFKLLVPAQPRIVNALGAALIAEGLAREYN